MDDADLKSYLNEQQQRVDARLAGLMAPDRFPASGSRLPESMCYSVFAGGKRLRPIILIAAHELFSPLTDYALDAACALEFIHTYSLIHDDLPSFDDDSLRRGKPTNHVTFGEWMAILAGDGLNTYAFEILAQETTDVSPEVRIEAVRLVAKAAGPSGMVLGQALDMAFEGEAQPRERIELMQSMKTGQLLKVPAELGALLGGGDREDRHRLAEFGRLIGQAFQIKDDLLDFESTQDELGKSLGKDASSNKATLPAVIGIEPARAVAGELIDKACDVLGHYGDKSETLLALSRYIMTRRH